MCSAGSVLEPLRVVNRLVAQGQTFKDNAQPSYWNSPFLPRVDHSSKVTLFLQ